jgi:flagellar motor component MotA
MKERKEIRVTDDITLRKMIEEKLTWAKLEQKKGRVVLEKQMQQIKENEFTMQKLSVVIDVLTDLLRQKDKDITN